MIKILFQGISVVCRSALVFLLFYWAKFHLTDVEATEIAMMVAESIFLSVILIFGQDQIFIYFRTDRVDRDVISIRIVILLLITLLFFADIISVFVLFLTMAFVFLNDIKSVAKYNGKHELDALANISALGLFAVSSILTDHLILAFTISVFIPSAIIWLRSTNLSKVRSGSIRIKFQFFISSLFLYSLLNVDWLFFKYFTWDSIFMDYSIVQKVVLNLSLLGSVLANVVVGWPAAVVEKKVLLYFACSVVLVSFVYLLSPYIFLSFFDISTDLQGDIFGLFFAILLTRMVLSWIEIPLKREAGPKLRIAFSFGLLMIYLSGSLLLVFSHGYVGLLYGMLLVNVLYILGLTLYNFKNRLWIKEYR
jgi:hypothetical protein